MSQLIHSTADLFCASQILKQGIKPSTETKETWLNVPSDKIFLIVRPDYQKRSVWGDYHFVISKKYIEEHADQFKAHPDSSSDKDFYEFIKGFRIQLYQGYDCSPAFNQIISLRPIQLEGLEKLFIPKTASQEEVNALKEELPAHIELGYSDI